jgi:hypothetical protein
VYNPELVTGNGTRNVVLSNDSRYLKITPLKSGGAESSIPVTALIAQSSDTNKATVSVTQAGKLSVKFKQRGTVAITVTAKNSNAGQRTTSVLTFNVIDASDVVDVITSSSVRIGDRNIHVYGYLLKSVTFKVKDAFKDYLTIVFNSTPIDVVCSESDGVYTVTNNQLTDNIPQVSINVNRKSNNTYFLGGGVSFIDGDPNTDYDLTSVDMDLVGYYGTSYVDGDTCAFSLAEWQDLQAQARFGIHPEVLRDIENVVTTVTSSDSSIVSVADEEPFVLGGSRRYNVNFHATGTVTLTLHVTDGKEYDETATITVEVTE